MPKMPPFQNPSDYEQPRAQAPKIDATDPGPGPFPGQGYTAAATEANTIEPQAVPDGPTIGPPSLDPNAPIFKVVVEYPTGGEIHVGQRAYIFERVVSLGVAGACIVLNGRGGTVRGLVAPGFRHISVLEEPQTTEAVNTQIDRDGWPDGDSGLALRGD